MSEIRKCKVSGVGFEINDEDGEFYRKIGVPLPVICPEERERKRLIWRNERHLYRRVCGLCSKPIIAIYSEECPFPVYCEKCFWSDDWNSLSYGREFDFNRPFFEQLGDLIKVVPRLAITHTQCINSDYSLNCIQNKNCYFTSGADFNEDCFYAINTQRSNTCIDTYLLYDSELCYGSLDCSRAYHCIGCQECENIKDCYFLFDCKDCNYCAFSSNLRHKEYVLFNKQLSKEEYERELARVLKEAFQNYNWLEAGITKVREKAICRDCFIINCENVTGNYIKNCRNSSYIFDGEDLEDCKFIYYSFGMKDCYDTSCFGINCNLLYEVMSGTNVYNCYFSNAIWYVHDARYSIGAFNNVAYLFGCVSMKNHEKYVILNKQYKKEEYEGLVSRIIKMMLETGEYGEFFPEALSAFEYNRSAAFDYMPLSKEEAMGRGLRWYEGEEKVAQASGDNVSLCSICGKNFRLIAQEMDFYKRLKLPTPKFCWPCRLKKLIAARRPRELFKNNCKKCGMDILTPFSANRPETVYCEKCYLETVY